jgi:hypothetical protein
MEAKQEFGTADKRKYGVLHRRSFAFICGSKFLLLAEQAVA